MDQEADLRGIVVAAVNLSAAGDHDKAIALIESAGRAGLAHPIVRNVAGDIYLKLGRRQDALKAFETAVRKAPAYPEAHCNRGVALQQLGRLEEALASYDRALKLRPAYPIAHFNRGNALRELHRDADAIAAYDRAIRLHADFAEAYHGRGRVHLRAQEASRALDDFNRAIRLRQNYDDAEIGRMEALRDLSRHREALDAADRFLERVPDSAPAMMVRVTALFWLFRKAEALAAADALVHRHPGEPGTRSLRAFALRGLNRFEEALEEATEACRLAPRLAEAELERAATLGRLGRFTEQLASVERAEKLGAAWRDTAPMRATALDQLDRREEAGAIFRKLVALHGDDPGLAYMLALWLLEEGDYARGFAAYEHRLAPGAIGYTEVEELAPHWQGEPMPGRKLYVHAEQGLGDAIQFARFLPRVRESGAEILLNVPRLLQGLFRRLAGGMTLIDGLPRESVDAQVSILSLAAITKVTRQTLPAPPYLTADPERIEKWRQQIGPDGFRIGVVWQGNPSFESDRFRSVPLSALAPLAALPGIRLISLQAMHGLDQLDHLPEGMRVETLGPDIADPVHGLDEIAAVLDQIDLLVTIDSAICHLAGALGRPTFLLARIQPEWRWPRGETESAWYPKTRVFRQQTVGDWTPPIAELMAAVEERLGA